MIIIILNLDCSNDSLLVTQMQPMEFIAHQAMLLQTHTQTQKLQKPLAPKIKQETRNQSQLLAQNLSPFHPGASGRGVGPPSPNAVMKHNMNISSPPMMSDLSVDPAAGGGCNTLSAMTNTSIKGIMSQSMCLKSSSNANAINQNLGNNVLSTGMGNATNIMNNIDTSAGLSGKSSSCTDMDAKDVVSTMMQQQQHPILRNKAMVISGIATRPPPPEYKGNTMIKSSMIQQSTGNQFSKVAPPPSNIRHMPPSGMFYK